MIWMSANLHSNLNLLTRHQAIWGPALCEGFGVQQGLEESEILDGKLSEPVGCEDLRAAGGLTRE